MKNDPTSRAPSSEPPATPTSKGTLTDDDIVFAEDMGNEIDPRPRCEKCEVVLALEGCPNPNCEDWCESAALTYPAAPSEAAPPKCDHCWHQWGCSAAQVNEKILALLDKYAEENWGHYGIPYSELMRRSIEAHEHPERLLTHEEALARLRAAASPTERKDG